RSIRPTSWPTALAAAPTEARPWSMKLASTLGRFLKLSKPGRAMPGKTSVTRIGDRLSTSSLEDRLEGARLGVPGGRGGVAAQERAQEEVHEAEASRAVGVPDACYQGRDARPLREGGHLGLAVALRLAVGGGRAAGARLVEGELLRPGEALRLDAAREDEVAGSARLGEAEHVGGAG